MKKLNELGGAPKGAKVIRINGFYKSDKSGGVVVTFNVKDETAAKKIYKLLCAVELDYESNPAEQNEIANLYIGRLENKDAFIEQNPFLQHSLRLLLSIWLLEKENLMPCDDYNGVEFISSKK